MPKTFYYQEIIDFWFVECDAKQWFQKDLAFDTDISRRFSAVHQAAAVGELWSWRQNPEGRLAEVILLDQFSRNMFRDTAQSFHYDALALVLAQEAVNVGADQALSPQKRSFLYMPYMHSESLLIHEQAVQLFDQPGLEDNLRFELLHKQIIERFGRYPHRNQLLARDSSEQEIEFLTQPGSSF